MGWTKFRMIAQRRTWTNDGCDHDGPACYELAIGGPRGGDMRIVYVGETSNERARISSYARDGSHLADIIRSHLRDGWCLYYRGYAQPSKKRAVAMQNRLLAGHDYDWNILLNG